MNTIENGLYLRFKSLSLRLKYKIYDMIIGMHLRNQKKVGIISINDCTIEKN